MLHRPLPPAMEPAQLIWRDGVPESGRFGDVYYNRDNGLAESRHVFIAASDLPSRFRNVPGRGHFVIAENGFGTGLNFLASWLEWQAQRSPDDNATLHFISVERFPLTRADLEKALSHWPELRQQAAELIRHYPPLMQGSHRILLDQGRVRLTLYFGDVLEAWRELTFKADAWFLDGFSPLKNPDMWQNKTIDQIASHSKPGTSVATFTAVGDVRRALTNAGFNIKKTTGFGRKWDMLVGTYINQRPREARDDTVRTETVAVIGAGIAGTLLARNLAERGVSVMLMDKAGQPGSAASGNPQGALYVKLGVEYNAQTELAATALSFSQRFYSDCQSDFWHPTGLLQLATSPQEADRQRRFCERNAYPQELMTPVDASQATELAGIPVHHSGLWFPGSGWLAPASACARMAEHPLISTRFGHQITRILPHAGQWCLRDSEGEDQVVDTVIIAGGHEAGKLVPVSGELRLKPIRGQTTQIPEPLFNLPRTVICGSRYLNPASNGYATTGATFDLRDDNPTPTAVSNQENLEELQTMLPGISAGNITGQWEGRVAFRCTTHDYQPVAGMLEDNMGHPVKGVYLMTGLGSKGLAWAPLLAEYLADVMTGQPQCLPARLAKRLGTGRLYRA